MVYEQQELELPLIAVDGDGPPLLGRNWLEQLQLVWRNIFHVSKGDTLSDVLSGSKMIFDMGLGTIRGFKADIKLQDGAKPTFCNMSRKKMRLNGVTWLHRLSVYPRKLEVYAAVVISRCR